MNIVISFAEKSTPKGVDKNQFLVKALKFIAKLLKLLHAIQRQRLKEGRVDVLSVAGTLLLIVDQSETFVYQVIENLRKAQSVLSSTCDLNEICSIDSKAIQNSKDLVDMIAIRNCISHSAYIIEENNEVVVDFHRYSKGL